MCVCVYLLYLLYDPLYWLLLICSTFWRLESRRGENISFQFSRLSLSLGQAHNGPHEGPYASIFLTPPRTSLVGNPPGVISSETLHFFCLLPAVGAVITSYNYYPLHHITVLVFVIWACNSNVVFDSTISHSFYFPKDSLYDKIPNSLHLFLPLFFSLGKHRNSLNIQSHPFLVPESY